VEFEGKAAVWGAQNGGLGAGCVWFPRGLGMILRVSVGQSMWVCMGMLLCGFSLFNLLVLFYRIDHNSNAIYFPVRKTHGRWGLAISGGVGGLDNEDLQGNSGRLFLGWNGRQQTERGQLQFEYPRNCEAYSFLDAFGRSTAQSHRTHRKLQDK
jgi:hypothetical protein